MRDGNLLILKGHEVRSLLEGQELELIELIRRAYAAHGARQSSLPHSVFLRFPYDQRARVIALPAYLGGEFAAAGIKWVASFPGNLEKGLDRASAVIVLNSTENGRPEAIVEGSIISAKRTAASAALAARYLHREQVPTVGLLGCGLINFEILRFLSAAYGRIETLMISDLDVERAEQFKQKCISLYPEQKVIIELDVQALLRSCSLLSLATTATKPHLLDLSGCPPGSTILHVSLRDLSPEVILSNDNVVDDIDHVCRAETSIHLAEQLVGHRKFIRSTLADVFTGMAPEKRDAAAHTIFSPFGLGVLDIAVGRWLSRLAQDEKYGTVIESFLPHSWSEGS
jgi:N-[(2S)-2-amino-2-carboxyethyl]-L-glutamate dehydrogenase